MLAFGAEFVQGQTRGKARGRGAGGAADARTRSRNLRGEQDNQSVSLRFERQLCYDTMADAVFGWTASVTANGETLKGCAWQR